MQACYVNPSAPHTDHKPVARQARDYDSHTDLCRLIQRIVHRCMLHKLVGYCWWHHCRIKYLPKRICSCNSASFTVELLPASTGSAWWTRRRLRVAHVLPNARCMLPDSTEGPLALQHLATLHVLRAYAADLQEWRQQGRQVTHEHQVQLFSRMTNR